MSIVAGLPAALAGGCRCCAAVGGALVLLPGPPLRSAKDCGRRTLPRCMLLGCEGSCNASAPSSVTKGTHRKTESQNLSV